MKKDLEKYIADLEEKLVELSLKLKNNNNKLNTIEEDNKKLISALIHNLKNPIGSVLSFSEIILESAHTYPSEKLEKYVTIINNSASYSIQLLNSIALLNEIKGRTFEKRKTNFIEITQNAIRNFQEIALKRQIKLVEKTPNNPIYLNLNTDHILIALENIISNALRFSNENSTVTIEIKEHSNTVEAIITDEGIGISETDLFSVFKEFFVVNTYSIDKKKCIGLGLPIVKNILENHDGKISIKSSENQGSQVKILLPYLKS